MPLPSAEEFRALLTAARDCGVTRVKFSEGDNALEVELAAVSPGERIVEKLNSGGHLDEDPMTVIRREAAAGNKMPARDMLDHLVSGGRFVQVSGDPTQGD